MKNPFDKMLHPHGTYRPQIMESAYGLPPQDVDAGDQHSPAGGLTMSFEDVRADTSESSNNISIQNAVPVDAGATAEKSRNKSVWHRFFLRLLCLGSGENESDSEIYNPDPQVGEQKTLSHDEEVVQQDGVTTPPVEEQRTSDSHDISHTRSTGNNPKKGGILRRFFSKLLCLGSRKSTSEDVEDHDPSDSFLHMTSLVDSDTGTYVPSERYDEDISFIHVKNDTPSIEEASTSDRPLPVQATNVQVEHNKSSTEEVDTSTSQQPLKKDSSKLQPITQLKKQRPASYYHISPSTDIDASASSSSANLSTDTQIPQLLGNNPNNGVSFSQLSKNFKTHSTPDIATIFGSTTPDTRGKLRQKSTSLPDLHSDYLSSDKTIACTYNVPTNETLLQKVDTVENLSAAKKPSPTGKRFKVDTLSTSHSSLHTIHEEHDHAFSVDTCAGVRSAMRKINRSRLSERSPSASSKKHVSFAEKIYYAPHSTRSDSAISKIISLFEEKSETSSQNLPKNLPGTMHR